MIAKENWLPADNKKLEDNALKAVKSPACQMIIAGPGAGKTELLAQRACYLLQTGECETPKRILAISFKRDAAQNLAERVEKRCGRTLAKRFDSMTFDAFAKNLLDRFMSGLPDDYRPRRDYKILLDDDLWQNLFDDIDRSLSAIMGKNGLKNIFLGASLPLPDTSDYREAKIVWNTMLHKGNTSYLTFQMITRLTELLLTKNPLLILYLQKTYSHVFLDEFQDTTNLQYDLLKVGFINSTTTLTAVGDHRQRIMVWAGALNDSFEQFGRDFGATQSTLLMNYRSAPRLVELQKQLSQTLLNQPIDPISSNMWKPDDGIAEVWRFSNHHEETAYLVTQIMNWVNGKGLNPRDICILVKQQVQIYGKPLMEALNSAGVNARDENFYQDKLTEDIVSFLLNFLRWIIKDDAIKESQWIIDFMSKIENVVSEKHFLQLENSINGNRRNFREQISTLKSEEDWSMFIRGLLGIISQKKLEVYYPDYRNDEFIESLIDKFFIPEFISWLRLHGDPELALDCVAGSNSIPVMTTHKSKGLEYDTVIFLGLEDNAFWNFNTQPEEDKCTFFVAMSRAKRRVIFTFAESRPDKYNQVTVRSNTNISSLYEALKNSNIAEDKEIV